MSNERIDLEAINMPDMKYFTNEATWQGWHDTVEEMIAELKRMYEREDEFLQAIDGWGMVICPRSGEWFEWDYGCQSESCVDKEDCRELVEQQ